MTEYLLASGWSNHSVPGYPHVLLESPARQLHLTLEPEEDEFMSSWRVHPAQGYAWSAQFGIHTPVEIIAGFTDALHSTGPRPEEAELWRLAASRGWTMRLAGRERAALSPDETAYLSRESSLAETPIHRWSVQVSVPLTEKRHRWIWNASIDEAAPPAALTGFIDALTDPAPLPAGRGRNRGTPSASSTPGAAPSHRNSTACSICGASKPINAPAPPRPRRHHPDQAATRDTADPGGLYAPSVRPSRSTRPPPTVSPQPAAPSKAHHLDAVTRPPARWC